MTKHLAIGEKVKIFRTKRPRGSTNPLPASLRVNPTLPGGGVPAPTSIFDNI